MTDASDIATFFGKDVLGAHKIKPWWEVLHTECLTLHATFVILIFASYLTWQSTACFPQTSVTNEEFAEVKASFVSTYCSLELTFGTDYVSFVVVIFALYVLAYSNVWFNSSCLINAIEVFSSVETTFWKLGLPLDKIKNMAITPNIQQSEEIARVHGIVEKIWLTRDIKMAEATWTYINRLWSVLIYLLLGVLIFGFMSIKKELGFAKSSTFNCSVPFYTNFTVPSNISSQYTCVFQGSQLSNIIMTAYAILCFLHGMIMLKALKEMGQMSLEGFKLINPKDGSKKCMLLLTKLYSRANPISYMPFANFVEFVFNDDTCEIMSRHLHRAISTRSEVLTPKQSIERDGKIIESLSDPGYVQVVSKMKGAGFLFKTLLEMFQNNRKIPFDLVLSRLTWETWDDDWSQEADSFFQEVFNSKQFKLFVLLLNSIKTVKMLEKFCTVQCYDLKEIENDSEGNSTGNSILYYALHRQPGYEEFKMTAVRHILKYSAKTQELVLYCGGNCIEVEDFVEKQYRDDLTYPLSLKRSLIDLLKLNNRNPSNLSYESTHAGGNSMI